jgi:transposase InsO family protein
MRDIAAASWADPLIAGWISRYGVLVQLTSDRGTQFTSAIWDALCQQLGIQHQPTTAFHPQANGMVERCHRRLKDALRACLVGPDWPLHLPWVLMGLRAAPTEDTGVSAAEVVFGALLVLPGQILDTEELPLADFISKMRQSGPPPPSRPLSYAQMAAKPAAALLSAAFVYVRKGGTVPPLSLLYRGPYKVLASGPNVFRLQVGETVSIDRLKPHQGAAPVQLAQPPSRGLPRAG